MTQQNPLVHQVPADLSKADKIWFGKLDNHQGIWVLSSTLATLASDIILTNILKVSIIISVIWTLICIGLIWFFAFYHKKGYEDISIWKYYKYKRANAKKTRHIINMREDIVNIFPAGHQPEEFETLNSIFTFNDRQNQ